MCLLHASACLVRSPLHPATQSTHHASSNARDRAQNPIIGTTPDLHPRLLSSLAAAMADDDLGDIMEFIAQQSQQNKAAKCV
jgi:hypothetical protein